jgi:hypothetical protein
VDPSISTKGVVNRLSCIYFFHTSAWLVVRQPPSPPMLTGGTKSLKLSAEWKDEAPFRSDHTVDNRTLQTSHVLFGRHVLGMVLEACMVLLWLPCGEVVLLLKTCCGRPRLESFQNGNECLQMVMWAVDAELLGEEVISPSPSPFQGNDEQFFKSPLIGWIRLPPSSSHPLMFRLSTFLVSLPILP